MPALFLQARMASRWALSRRGEKIRCQFPSLSRSASSYNSTCKPVSEKLLARMLWMVCIMLCACRCFKQFYLIMLFVVGLFACVLSSICMLSAGEVIKR